MRAWSSRAGGDCQVIWDCYLLLGHLGLVDLGLVVTVRSSTAGGAC